MKKEGIVIWLDESVDVLVKRLSSEKAHRPLIANLSENELAAFLEQKLVERHPFYKQADYRLTSDQITESGLKKLIQKHAS
jgi:shikimate kinase